MMVWSVALAILGWHVPAAPIEVDEAVISVGLLAESRDAYFVMDQDAHALYKIDHTGGLLAVYAERGLGPGEFSSMAWITIHHERLYLLDQRQYKILVFDMDLNFLEQHVIRRALNYSCLAVTDDAMYLFGYDPANDKVVHKYDHNLKHNVSFCSGLDASSLSTTKLMLANLSNAPGGRVFVRNDKVYVGHPGKFQVEIFDLNGKQQQVLKLPGVDPNTFFNDQTAFFDVRALYLYVDGAGNIYNALTHRLGVKKSLMPQNLYYKYDPNLSVWRKTIFRNSRLYALADGTFLAGYPHPETDRVMLQPLNLTFD